MLKFKRLACEIEDVTQYNNTTTTQPLKMKPSKKDAVEK